VEEEQRVLTNILATANGMTQLTPENFQSVVLAGEDTWLVHFYNSGSKENKRTMNDEDKRVSKMWNQLAGKLNGVVSVGAFDVAGDAGAAGRHGLTLEQLAAGPQIRLYPGLCVSAHKDLNPASKCVVGRPVRGDPVDYSGKIELDDLEEFALNAMKATDSEGFPVPRGSVTTVGVKARRLLTDAEVMLRSVTCIKSNN
jgi:hypothetical protein